MAVLKRREEIKMSSEWSFGLVFAIFFGIIALWPLAKGGTLRFWAIVVALAFVGLGYWRPAVLRPLNIAWFRLGLLLSAVVTPVAMALLYVTTLLPTSLVLRLVGRNSLELKREPDRASYWVIRDGSRQATMKRQF